jgi:hypothetical protein
MDHMRFENIVRDLTVDDAARAAEMQQSRLAERCYLIFFTARSGSSWLTSLLSATKQLGFPEEFLNPNFVRKVAASLNARTQADLLNMLRRRKRTANGIFGMEVRHVDVELFGEDVFFETFGSQTTVFNLWRDNIVSQGGIAVPGGEHRALSFHRCEAVDAAAIRWRRDQTLDDAYPEHREHQFGNAGEMGAAGAVPAL